MQLNSSEALQQYSNVLNKSTEVYHVTDHQYDLINQLIELDEEFKQTLTYEEYENNPSMYTASAFIAESSELLASKQFSNKDYMKYIAERPGVEKNITQDHGLFDRSGPADYDFYYNALQKHVGNVWRHIISLRREDAHHLGYESKESWRILINNHIDELAQDIGLSSDKLHWTAAFHDEGYHPHIHMMFWSDNEKEGFQDLKAISNFRSSLTKDIFSDEIWLREQFKDEIRDDFEQTFRMETNHISDQVFKNSSEILPDIAKSLVQLSYTLPDNGKQYYGYQKADIKNLCNQIIANIMLAEQLTPMLEKYLESQRLLASMYMKDDSEAMNNYMQDAMNRIIAPHKGDRKVMHNYILQKAFEIKQERTNKQVMFHAFCNDMFDKIEDESFYKKDSKLAEAIIKIEMQRLDPEQTINVVIPYCNNEVEALELYLEAKADPNINKIEIALLNKNFHESLQSLPGLNDECLPIHEAAKILQHVLMSLEGNKAQIDRETSRMFNVHRQEEFSIRNAKYSKSHQ